METDDIKFNRYTEAIKYCQQSFSARMQLPNRGIAFVEQIDREHEPIERELREGFSRIEQTYKNVISDHGWKRGLSGSLGAGFGYLYTAFMAAGGPVTWILGGVVGGGTAYFFATVATKLIPIGVAEAALEELFQREIVFVRAHLPALTQRIQEHPEEQLQLNALNTQFNWVLERVEAIRQKVLAAIDRETARQNQFSSSMQKIADHSRKSTEEQDRYNRNLALTRSMIR